MDNLGITGDSLKGTKYNGLMQEFDEHTILKPKTATFDFSRFEKPKSKANSERASLIEPFVIKLNNSRIVGGYKPYSTAFIASKMSHIKTKDLHAHYKMLDSSKNFCALWHWYNTNPKKKTK
jgi:hypothetical protein